MKSKWLSWLSISSFSFTKQISPLQSVLYELVRSVLYWMKTENLTSNYSKSRNEPLELVGAFQEPFPLSNCCETTADTDPLS